jgi:hypothetical protein
MATALFGGLSGRRLTSLVGENVFRWAGQLVVPNWVWGKLVRISVVGLQPNPLENCPLASSVTNRFTDESTRLPAGTQSRKQFSCLVGDKPLHRRACELAFSSKIKWVR